MTRLSSCTLLLRRLSKMNGFLEQNDMTEEDVNKVIKAYEVLIDFEEASVKLKANHFVMIKLFKYDLNNLQNITIGHDMIIFPTEQYDRVMDTFEKFNILSAETAENKVQEWKKLNLPPQKPGSNKSYTSKDTIERFYGIISSFYTAFYRSKPYVEAFGLPNENLDMDPIKIKEFVTRHEVQGDALSATPYSNFKSELNMYVGIKSQEFENNFVLSQDNLTAFPLFVRLGDYVLNSQAFGELYCYFLHAILNKDLFDKETMKRSREFEGVMVKKRFEEKGFTYKLPFKIKGKNPMEIDGLAISDSHVYVIEIKGWGIKRLIEDKSAEDILIRDIKNSIFGYHYVARNKKLKKTVSLLNKVKYVENNRQNLDIPSSSKISGLLIINEHAPFSECAGCTIQFLDDMIIMK